MSEAEKMPGEAGAIPFMDRMLEPADAAKWLGISERELAEKRRKKQIPAVVLGERSVRYHPRSIVAFFHKAHV